LTGNEKIEYHTACNVVDVGVKGYFIRMYERIRVAFVVGFAA